MGVSKIKASYYWDRGFIGQGVNVAILDSGIHDHEYLNISGKVYMGNITYPYNDHGTQVTSIIGSQPECPKMTGVAYGCNIYDVNVSNENESITASNVIEGIEWCIDNNIRIMNLSFYIYSTPELTLLFETTLEKAYDHGIIIIAPSGNCNEDHLLSPARLPYTFGIGLVDR